MTVILDATLAIEGFTERTRNMKRSMPFLFMFATESYVQARRGKHGTSRFVYLQRLVTEYQDTQKLGIISISSECVEAQRQIIANLANFAYDPYNYVIMRELNIVVYVKQDSTLVGFVFRWIIGRRSYYPRICYWGNLQLFLW